MTKQAYDDEYCLAIARYNSITDNLLINLPEIEDRVLELQILCENKYEANLDPENDEIEIEIKEPDYYLKNLKAAACARDNTNKDELIKKTKESYFQKSYNACTLEQLSKKFSKEKIEECKKTAEALANQYLGYMCEEGFYKYIYCSNNEELSKLGLSTEDILLLNQDKEDLFSQYYEVNFVTCIDDSPRNLLEYGN